MMSTAARVWLTAVLVGLSYAATSWVRAGYSFEVLPLERDLTSIPLILDGWEGNETPLDEQVSRVLNAQASMNRVYQNRKQESVVTQIAAWLDPRSVSDVAPHIPRVCYTNTGWKIIEERTIDLETSQGVVPMVLMFLEKHEERIVVAYWYQMGDSRFTTVEQARQIHRHMWGKHQWPPTVKVLLQTSADSLSAGRSPIEAMARLIIRELSTSSKSNVFDPRSSKEPPDAASSPEA